MPRPLNFFSLAVVEPILQHEGFSFTFTLLYIFVNLVVFFAGASPEWHNFEGASRFMRCVVASARGGGSLLNFNSALIILVASRVFMTVLRRTPLNMVIPFDKAMPNFHAAIGITLSVATVLHVIPHAINYAVSDLATSGVHGHVSLAVSGSVLTAVILVMRVTTLKTIRRRMSFEAFYVTHIAGFLIYFLALILHGSNYGHFSSYKFVTGPLLIYCIDIIFRRFRNRGRNIVIPGDTATTSGADIVRLEMPRTFSYLPGQYCYLNVPAISRFQWHPFSIASSPSENKVVFYIKVNGDWTQALYNRAQGYQIIHVYIRGPFGAPAQHVGQYEHVILISGGVGATPFTSIVKFANHWICNHTSYGYQSATSAYAAYERNFSIRSAMVPSSIAASSRGLRNSQALGQSFVADPFSEYRHTTMKDDAESEPEEVISVGSLRHILKLGDRPQLYKFDTPRKTRGAAHRVSDLYGRPALRKPEPRLPVDYNSHLGDPTAPIPERKPSDLDLEVPSDFPKLSSNRSWRRLENRRYDVEDRKFDLYDQDDVEEDDITAASALEAQIIYEQQQTPSNRLKNIGVHVSPDYISAQLSSNGLTKQGTMGLSDIPDDATEEEASWRDRLLFYVHSVTLNWVFIWIMMTRFTLAGMGRSTESFNLRQRGLSVYLNDVLNILDLSLSLTLFLPILATVIVEMSMYGPIDFFRESIGNAFDLMLVMPLTLVCVLLHVLGLANIGEKVPHVSKVTVLVIWPVLSIFLLWRIIRTIGARVAIAQFMKSALSRTKSLDFLWVSRSPEDDIWIVNELLPVTLSGAVRIHRFITKSERREEEWMQDFEELPFKTSYERPSWDKVFGNLVEKSKSGSVIGVFFCGPHAMARVVQLAAMNAMRKSVQNALDRRYDGGIRGSRLSTGGGSRSCRLATEAGASMGCETQSWSQEIYDELIGAAAFGCNVRISVRIENFS